MDLALVTYYRKWNFKESAKRKPHLVTPSRRLSKNITLTDCSATFSLTRGEHTVSMSDECFHTCHHFSCLDF